MSRLHFTFVHVFLATHTIVALIGGFVDVASVVNTLQKRLNQSLMRWMRCSDEAVRADIKLHQCTDVTGACDRVAGLLAMNILTTRVLKTMFVGSSWTE